LCSFIDKFRSVLQDHNGAICGSNPLTSAQPNGEVRAGVTISN
jgi:hypothetical protein